MKHFAPLIAALLLFSAPWRASATASPWVEGRHYVRLEAPQPTRVPRGKIEVMEVFSYGCVFCNNFQPVIEQLRARLPANAQMVFLPAAFLPAEDWPMFQRAYFAAQSLGIADQAHQAMFDAVWRTGELAIVDSADNRLKSPPPSLEDAARCYERITGIGRNIFLQAARSATVDARIQAANAQIVAMKVPGTPCLIVNGKYRIALESLSSVDEVVDLVNFLIAKESPHRGKP